MVQCTTAVAITGILLAVIIILVVSLLPASFPALEFYELGFQKRISTGYITTDRVYEGGRYFLGLDYDFHTYPANAQFVEFDDSVFTSNKLEVSIHCHFQYFLRPHQLHLLHSSQGANYKNVIENDAVTAIKGAATVYSSDDFLYKRNVVKDALFSAVRQRLSGSCCDENSSNSNSSCVLCTKTTDCETTECGLYVDVRYFQLQTLRFRGGMGKTYLQAIVLQIEEKNEEFKRSAVVVRKETDKMVEASTNTAREIEHNSTATSTVIVNQAKAQAKALLEKARTDGLKLLYNRLNITDGEQRAAFDYLRTLRNQPHVSLNVNFQQLVAMQGKLTS